ncbi:DUF2631 domain-containing protein [Mycolicibacterium setense]
MIKRPDTWWPRIGEFLTGEWMFWWGRPNGGLIIWLRAIQVAATFYVLAFWLYTWSKSEWSFRFDSGQFGKDIAETIPWIGAIFLAVYAALYARFSNQMNYLSGTYNLLMQTQATIANPNDNEKIRYWKAAFVEDAEDLHLATKPMFSVVIALYLIRDATGKVFEDNAVNGIQRRKDLIKLIECRLQRSGAPLPESITDAHKNEELRKFGEQLRSPSRILSHYEGNWAMDGSTEAAPTVGCVDPRGVTGVRPNTELQPYPDVDEADVPSARWGWSKINHRTLYIAGWFIVGFLLLTLHGNHRGHVEDIFVIGFASAIAGALIRDLWLRRRGRRRDALPICPASPRNSGSSSRT